MDIAIQLIAKMLPSLVLLIVLFMGFKLATEDTRVQHSTPINKVIQAAVNKIIASIYVMGSFIALTIIWF